VIRPHWVLVGFAAREPLRGRMDRIALNLDGATVLERDEQTASVRAVERAGQANFFWSGHDFSLRLEKFKRPWAETR
jgi:hypothetical protein